MTLSQRPLTFEAHMLSVVNLIGFYLEEACYIAKDYANYTPSSFARTKRQYWRSDLLRSLGNVVSERARSLQPSEAQEDDHSVSTPSG